MNPLLDIAKGGSSNRDITRGGEASVGEKQGSMRDFALQQLPILMSLVGKLIHPYLSELLELTNRYCIQYFYCPLPEKTGHRDHSQTSTTSSLAHMYTSP